MKALASIIGIAALTAATSASAAPKQSSLTSTLFGETSYSQPGRGFGSAISHIVRNVLRGLHKGWDRGHGHSPGHGGGHCRGHVDDWCGPASP